ncbi:bifunctional trypsin-like peptidase domain-containing/SEL1-like repeat protein [Candidatus Uabimicrobium sp. HlEnr_7]|uniref:bifunctional trypsin-like peptidase domain-containing/SEL1-like repeat protein n=1 Tax=Candidatus Uabimicrobium helgolandensis TaxID=3095367 RepID=UPI0035564EC0
MFNNYIITLLLFFASHFLFAQKSDKIVHIASEIEYKCTYQEPRKLWGTTTKTSTFSEIVSGAGFLIGDYIITARHVVTGKMPSQIAKLGKIDFSLKNNKIHSSNCRVRVSSSSFTPTTIYISPDKDIAILKLSKEDSRLLTLKQLSLSSTSPVIEQKVKAWGFPSTVNPQVKTDLLVTSVKNEWFVLDKPLGSGFSGGPVIDSSGVIGIISRSEKKQSRIVKFGQSDIANAILDHYVDGMIISSDQKLTSVIDHETKVYWYRNLIRNDNAQAMYNLGCCFYYGEGVEQDYEVALQWWRKAMACNNSSAIYDLGACYYYGVGVRQSKQRAIYLWLKAANLDNPYAMNFLGNCYYSGEGVRQDYKRAVKWYEKASFFGLQDAKQNLIYCQKNGLESKNKLPQLQLAVQQNIQAMVKVGKTYLHGTKGQRKNYKEAKRWIYKAAKDESPEAQVELAFMFKDQIATIKNDKETIYWLKRSAKQNYDKAYYFLGHMHRGGIGVEKNFKKAMEYFQKAAENKDSTAIALLGLMYQKGEGVKQNLNKALELYQESAKLGDPYAMNLAGDCFFHGIGTGRDYTKAVRWYQKAHRFKNNLASYSLGNCYFSGHGVKKDLEKAIEWWEVSATAGNSIAMKKLASIYKAGKLVTKNMHKAMVWYQKAIDAEDQEVIEKIFGLIE